MLKSLFFALFFAFSLYYAYDPWLRPEKYLKRIRARRHQADERNPFVWFQLRAANYINKHSASDIWLARVSSALLVVISIVALLASLV